MIFKNPTILSAEGVFAPSDMAFQDEINDLGTCTPQFSCMDGLCGFEPSVDMTDYYLVPGLIDIHTHGGKGVDLYHCEAKELDNLSLHYASCGVTSFCPTTMSLPMESLLAVVKKISNYKNPVASQPIGIYLEGPFFHPEKRGAQSHQYLKTPSYDFYKHLQENSGNLISVVSLAPELEGAMEFIEQVSKEVKVALGHSTADYDTAKLAFSKGASLVTHLFNGMTSFSHKEPALWGAAFDSDAYAELICDGIHVHPSAIRLAFQTFGDKLCLISDSLSCANMPDGTYQLSGETVTKEKDKAVLEDGTLAGSSIGLLQAVHNAISFGISPEKVFYAASTAPAHALGLEEKIGSLEIGKSADFLVLDKEFKLISTYVQGKKVYEN